MISSGWRKARIGEIAEVKGGKRLPAGYYLQATPTHRPYIRVADMRVGGVDQSDIKYVPEGAISRIQNYRIYKDDIFISVAGTLGIVGRVPISLDGANLTENADRLTNIKCDVAYLMYALQSNPIQHEIDSIRTVGAQPKLALSRIRSFEILMPSDQAEQSRVSRALSDTDDLIESLERLISKKQAIKQGLMQELLTGRTRLPGFIKDWTRSIAGELGVFKGGIGFPVWAQGGKSGAYRFFKVSDMNLPGNETVMKTSNNWISENIRRRLTATALPAGAIVFAKVGAAVYLERKRILGIPSCIDNNMAAFIPDLTQIDNRFAYYYLLSFPLSSLVAMGALPSLNSSQLRSIPFHFPADLEEQKAIAQILQDADQEIATLERRLESARNIKQGMMQELLTGRTRLPIEEVSS